MSADFFTSTVTPVPTQFGSFFATAPSPTATIGTGVVLLGPDATSGPVDAGSTCSSASSHKIAIAAGLGVAVGVITATILILAFVVVRRHQARKASATISPDIMVRGPKHADDADSWTGQYREDTQNMVGRGGNLAHSKEPPSYTKAI